VLQKNSIFSQNKQAPRLEPGACNFTAIINTNHQRKNFHSKAEIFLFYRRNQLLFVTAHVFFNLVLILLRSK